MVFHYKFDENVVNFDKIEIRIYFFLDITKLLI